MDTTATETPRKEGGYRWIIVLVLAAITNVSYGTLLYAFSVLLGEDAAAGEFGWAILPMRADIMGRHFSGALCGRYMKMSSGSKALTSRFGTSTVWLMRKSTATLHSA